MFCEL